MYAVQDKRKEIIEILLKYGVEINAYSSDGCTALHLAVVYEFVEIIEILLDNAKAKLLFNKNMDTPLELALVKNNDEITNLIIEKAINLEDVLNREIKRKIKIYDEENTLYFTPLTFAIFYKRYTIAHKLITKGANINYQFKDNSSSVVVLLNLCNEEDFETILKEYGSNLKFLTILEDYAKSNRMSLVASKRCIWEFEKFVEHLDADFEETDINGNTALHIATKYQQLNMIKLLVEKYKLKINAVNLNKYTPLEILIYGPKEKEEDIVEGIEFLIEKGVSINNTNIYNNNLFHSVALAGNIKVFLVLKKIIQENYCAEFINAVNIDGDTPLLFAVHKDEKFIRSLISAGADIKRKNIKSGWSVLHAAAKFLNDKIIIFLCENGVMVDDKDIKGNTALHIAVLNNITKKMALFIKNTFIESKEIEKIKETLELQYINVIENLLKCKADINAKNNSGETPLMLLINKENIDKIKFLLKYNPKLEIINDVGNNVLHISIIENVPEIFKLFIDYLTDSKEKKDIIDAQNKNGHTPLRLAIIFKNMEIVKLLLKNKATIKNELDYVDKTCDYEMHQLILYAKERQDFEQLMKKKSEKGSQSSLQCVASITTQTTKKLKKLSKSGNLQYTQKNTVIYSQVNKKDQKTETTDFKKFKKWLPIAKVEQHNVGNICKDLTVINKAELKAQLWEDEQRRLKVKQQSDVKQEQLKQEKESKVITISNLIETKCLQKTNLCASHVSSYNLQLVKVTRNELAKKIDDCIFRVRRSEEQDHLHGRPAIWIAKKDSEILVLLSSSEETWEKKDKNLKEKYKYLKLKLEEGGFSIFYKFAWIIEDNILDKWSRTFKLTTADKISISEMVSINDLKKLYPEKNIDQSPSEFVINKEQNFCFDFSDKNLLPEEKSDFDWEQVEQLKETETENSNQQCKVINDLFYNF